MPHCKRCTSYGNSVVLSVCLSHAGTVSKRLHVARSSLHYWIAQEAQLPQRDCATPKTHFTRERRMDRWKDEQKAVARTRYAVCVTRKKGLRPKKPTEKIAGQRSYTVQGHRFWYQWGHQMQVFCCMDGRSQETIRIQKRYFDRVHKPPHIIRTI